MCSDEEQKDSSTALRVTLMHISNEGSGRSNCLESRGLNMAYEDDYKRRDFNDYLNRQQDRLDFERVQRDRTSSVYDSIREKDEFKVRSALDLPSPGSSSDSRSTPPTAGEQFREHSNSLLFYLKWSDALPESLRQAWAGCIQQSDIELVGRNREALRCMLRAPQS